MATKRHRRRQRRNIAILTIAWLILLAALGIWLREAYRSEARIAGQVAWKYQLPGPTAQTPSVEAIRSSMAFLRAIGLTGDMRSRMQTADILDKTFPAGPVNFRWQMLLIVRGGVQPAAGVEVVVTGATFDKGCNALVVHWELRPRAAGRPVAGNPNEPVTLVLLERFNGDVTLDPIPDP